MTKREQKLFDIINEYDNPQEALSIALNSICDFLTELGASQDKHLASHQEFA